MELRAVSELTSRGAITSLPCRPFHERCPYSPDVRTPCLMDRLAQLAEEVILKDCPVGYDLAALYDDAAARSRLMLLFSSLIQRTTPDTPHFQGDASHIQDLGWDLVICHPPCTYLSNAGVQYLHTEPGRFDRMLEGVAQFKSQHATKAPFVCLEQPKIHGYARQELG